MARHTRELKSLQGGYYELLKGQVFKYENFPFVYNSPIVIITFVKGKPMIGGRVVIDFDPNPDGTFKTKVSYFHKNLSPQDNMKVLEFHFGVAQDALKELQSPATAPLVGLRG